MPKPLASRRIFGAFAVAAASVVVVVAAPAHATTPRARAADAPLVVSTSGARAVIDLHPFRLSFTDGAGNAALQEMPNTAPLPQVEPPTTDPIGTGIDNPVTTSLYQPLAFTVGTETLQQQPGLEWAGNLLAGERQGIQYSARDVLNETMNGDTVTLVLSTNDPTGRKLDVTISPASSGAIRVHAVPDPPTGVSEMGDAFVSDSTEAFHGFGGRHNSQDQHGQVISSFVNEENLAGDFEGVQVPTSLGMFPNGPTAAYYPQALFYSSHPYGFLADMPQLVRFKLDEDRSDAWDLEASASNLDYVVAPGTETTAMGTITALTGRQPVPPQWGLGPMLDRLVKNEGETEADYEANLQADIANIDKYQLPLTGYRIEGWGLDGVGGTNDGLALHTWVSVDAMKKQIADLKARGIHPLAYIRPWFTPGAHDDLAVKDANGKADEEDVDLGTNVMLPDFTNPATVKFWDGEIDKMLDLGFDGFMQDYGESVLFDMHFSDGSTGVTMHNAYLPLYDKTTRDEVDRYEAAHPGRQIFFFTRGGYSGLPGSAAYESGNFPGDETTDWGHLTGLQSLTDDMLNRAVGGAYGYGTDIGGYLDYTTPATTKELFLRWAEWAALSPVFRLHGSGLAGTHTPWSYDADTVATYKALSQLHLDAAPLIENLWKQAESTGVPPTRPLWLQFPGDAQAAAQDQEWMLGPQVLVAPVVTQGATSRSVYFPSGCWQDPATGERHTGPASATVSAPLDSLPYYFACGTQPFKQAVAVTTTVKKATHKVTKKRTTKAKAAQPGGTLAYTGTTGAYATAGLALLLCAGVAARRRRVRRRVR